MQFVSVAVNYKTEFLEHQCSALQMSGHGMNVSREIGRKCTILCEEGYWQISSCYTGFNNLVWILSQQFNCKF